MNIRSLGDSSEEISIEFIKFTFVSISVFRVERKTYNDEGETSRCEESELGGLRADEGGEIGRKIVEGS